MAPEGLSPATPPDRFRVGESLVTSARTISLADIDAFARTTGDENPLHLDETFAARQMFGGRVAHGLLTLSATLGLWYRSGFFDHVIVVFLGIDKLRFLKPVRPGDTLSSRLTIVKREPTERGDRVELENVTSNGAGEPVLTFTARLLVSPPRL